MRFFDADGRRYAQFERLGDEPALSHAFATRPFDVSARRDERQSERAARRARMAADLGFDAALLCYCIQAHETRVALIDRVGPGGALLDVDSVATNQAGVPLMTFSADCPLVLIYDPAARAVGLAHASWRCTVAEVAQRLVGLMASRFACRPPGMLAGIGPSAGPCCYEVKQDVLAAAADLPDAGSLLPRRGGRSYFDLWAANRAQLERAGLQSGNIETAGICTLCRNDLFYSYRREGRGCGHFGLMAGVRGGWIQP